LSLSGTGRHDNARSLSLNADGLPWVMVKLKYPREFLKVYASFLGCDLLLFCVFLEIFVILQREQYGKKRVQNHPSMKKC